MPECREYSDLCAEIQVRTVIQHAWAEIEHHLNYKPKHPSEKLNEDLERRLIALMALFEIADREFDSIRNEYESTIKSSKAGKDLEEITMDMIKDKSINKEIFLVNANYFLENKQIANLLRFSNEVLEIYPNLKEAWNYKGIALGHSMEYEKSITCFDKALEIDSKYKGAWYNKGTNLGHLGKYEEALLSFDKALEIDSKFLEAWSNKGICLGYLGKYKEALLCFDKTLEIDSKNKKAWNNKGKVLEILGKNKEALRCFNIALEIDPKYKNALINRIALIKEISNKNPRN